MEVHRIYDHGTRYSLLMNALDEDVFMQIDDVIAMLPPHDLYGTLKRAIIKLFSETPDRRLQKLLNEEQLNGRKPSQVLYRMRSLGQQRTRDDALRVK